MINDWITRIEKALHKSLPGETGQNKMAPSLRAAPGIKGNPDQSMPSGVLILLYPDKQMVNTVLIHRSSSGPHGGQISLPGGKKEGFDLGLEHTALRETKEEIGVHPERIRILGKLTQLFVPHSNFCIQPFVGWTDPKPVFKPDPKEVKRIIIVSLNHLFAPENRKKTTYDGKGYNITAPYYDVHGHEVWGATAMILSEFELVITS